MKSLSLLAVILAFTLSTAPPSHADDLATVRARWVAYLTSADRPPDDPATHAAIAKLDALTDESARVQAADGTWEADMKDQPANNAALWPIIYHRLRPLAQAWATPGSRRFHDPATVAVLVRAFDAYLPMLEHEAKERPGNWWIWDIGCPMDLGNTLLLIADALPPEQHAHAVAVLTSLLRLDGDDSPTEGVLNRRLRGKNSAGAMTGQNAIWVDMARMRLGLLTDDAPLVHTTAEDVAKVCARLPRADHYHEGVTPDGSYLIHGAQIMWSYGAGQVADTGLATMLLAGTGFALPPAAVAFQEDLLLDSARWCSTKYLMHPMIVGRDYSRNGAPTANGFLTGALQLALSDGPRHAECAALAKEWLADAATVGGVSDTLAGLVARVQALPGDPAKPLDGCRAFPDGDFLAIQRPGWGGGVKMYSERTLPFEIVNGEGLTSRHNSDGTLFLTTRTTDWPLPVMAALDWNHLPGATISAAQQVDNWTKPGEMAFVGSIADGRVAVAAQDLKVKELHARKSWLVFDDAIVCLGSGIVCPTSVDTTVAQTPVGAADGDALLDGKPLPETTAEQPPPAPVSGARWALAGDVGYVFPEPGAPLLAHRTTRARSKRVVNINGSDQLLAPVTFAELFLLHGTPTADAPGRYAYVVLPKQGADGVRAWAEKAPVAILAHDEKVHAARDARDGSGAAVFWEAGEAGELRVDAPCIALWKTAEGKTTVTVADPTHAARTITVSWQGQEKAVAVRDGRPGSATF